MENLKFEDWCSKNNYNFELMKQKIENAFLTYQDNNWHDTKNNLVKNPWLKIKTVYFSKDLKQYKKIDPNKPFRLNAI